MLELLRAKENDRELDHRFMAKLLTKINSKPINHTTQSDEETRFEDILNDPNMSLLPKSSTYKEEVGKPAWVHIRKISVWGSVKLNEDPEEEFSG